MEERKREVAKVRQKEIEIERERESVWEKVTLKMKKKKQFKASFQGEADKHRHTNKLGAQQVNTLHKAQHQIIQISSF